MKLEDVLFRFDVALGILWYGSVLYVAMVKRQKYFDSYNRINLTLLCILLWGISSALLQKWGFVAFNIFLAIFMQMAAYGYRIKENRVDTGGEA